MIDFSIFVFYFVFYFSWLIFSRFLERGKRLIFVFVIASLTLLFMAVVFLPDPTLLMPYCTNLTSTGCVSNTISLAGNQAFIFAFGSILLPFLMLV